MVIKNDFDKCNEEKLLMNLHGGNVALEPEDLRIVFKSYICLWSTRMNN